MFIHLGEPDAPAHSQTVGCGLSRPREFTADQLLALLLWERRESRGPEILAAVELSQASPEESDLFVSDTAQ